MLAWFLGLFFRLTWIRRLWCLVLFPAISVLVNIARALVLALAFDMGGDNLFQTLHDAVGAVAMVAVLAICLALAKALAPESAGDFSPPPQIRSGKITICPLLLVAFSIPLMDGIFALKESTEPRRE